MYVKRMSYNGYRNLIDSSVSLSPGVNIVYGENAQGKTNFLETIWLLAGGRSFRGTKDLDLIRFGENRAEVKGEFFSEEREQSIRIKIEQGIKKAYLNEVDKGRSSGIVGSFRAVIFSPIHLSLISGGPENRRRLIDTIICQLKPTYISAISRYNHILRQRNATLKDSGSEKFGNEILDVWDRKLAEYGALIIEERIRYTNLLEKKAKIIYQGISSGREEFKINYVSGALKENDMDRAQIIESLQEKILSSREYDKRVGYTSKGPHRDDIEFFLDDRAVKKFASQGQMRSSVLSVKMAEAGVMEDESGEKPVILFDDVMSELDALRQDYIINSIKDWQVIITSCDLSILRNFKSGKIMKIEQGKITEEKMI